MNGFLSVAFMFGLAVAAIFGFRLVADFVVTAFPAMGPLFVNNTVASIIFVVTSVFTHLGVFMGLIIAMIYGAVAFTPWYMPALQVLALELVWFILNVALSLVMGAGAGSFAIGANLLDKLDWINFKGRIGRKSFFIRMLMTYLFVVVSSYAMVTARSTFLSILSFFFVILTVLLMYSTYAKRLHDLGKPGYWSLGILTFNIATNSFPMFNLLVTIVITCAFCFINADNIPNQYGDPEN